jgi:glutathione S-transferase
LKLYYSPGACSLAVHIALEEAGIACEIECVDLESGHTESGADFTAINPQGYVPALVFDGGDVLTETLAVLDWVATQSPALGLGGSRGRSRLLETLACIATEVHKSCKPFFNGASDAETARARGIVAQRLGLLAQRCRGPYLFGARLSVADCYLFVMLLWAMTFGIAIPEAFLVLRGSMVSRPAVQRAMEREALRVRHVEGVSRRNGRELRHGARIT